MAVRLKHLGPQSDTAQPLKAAGSANAPPQLLLDALIKLNIARRNVLMYPVGHNEIDLSVAKAHQELSQILARQPKIQINVQSGGLMIDADFIENKNPIISELITAFRSCEIAQFSALRGISRQEIDVFLHWLAAAEQGDTQKNAKSLALAMPKMPHIDIKGIDYSRFQIVGTDRTTATDGNGTQGPLGSEAAGKLAGPGTTAGGEAVDQQAQIAKLALRNPIELARLINSQQVAVGATVNYYSKSLYDHLYTPAPEPRPSHEAHSLMDNLRNLSKHLNPTLRSQLVLAANREVRFAPKADAQTEIPVNTSMAAMVVEMLGRANKTQGRISPSLLSLVKAVSNTLVIDDSQTDDAPPMPNMSHEKMDVLASRENYEKYVGAGYAQLLLDLSENTDHTLPQIEQQLELKYHEKSLSESSLELQLVRAALHMIQQERTEVAYEQYSDFLLEVRGNLLQHGEFLLLHRILNQFKTDQEKAPRKANRAIAKQALDQFERSEFITRAVAALDARLPHVSGKDQAFILALGSGTIPLLLPIYLEKKDAKSKQILLRLLDHFKTETIDMLGDHLRAENRYSVLNGLRLARRLGLKQTLSQIKPLLNHNERQIRREALVTLVKFKQPEALAILESKLVSKRPEQFKVAAELCGRYHLPQMVPILVAGIKRPAWFKATVLKNTALVRALGEIGAPEAIPVLEAIAKTAFSFCPKELYNLKLAVYETLAAYPREKIDGLLQTGLKMRDKKIAMLCARLANATPNTEQIP